MTCAAVFNRGAGAEVIQEWLGHADLRMTRRVRALDAADDREGGQEEASIVRTRAIECEKAQTMKSKLSPGNVQRRQEGTVRAKVD